MPTSPAESMRFYETPPHEEHGAWNWYGRGQNFAIVYSQFDAGARFPIESPEYEYIALLVHGALDVTSEAGSASVAEPAVIIVPPGRSEAVASAPGVMVRVFAPAPPEWDGRYLNARSYDEPHHNVAPLVLWPEPVGGYRLRVYEYARMPEGKRNIRSRNIHAAWSGVFSGPQDPTGLYQPHYHEDFEHTFMCLGGHYRLHFRYRWEPDYTRWREDEHYEIGTPSLSIAPPPAIHSAHAIGDGNSMMDIAAPPRADLSLWGRVFEENAREYPLPPELLEPGAVEKHARFLC